jgi:hypothetical protein
MATRLSNASRHAAALAIAGANAAGWVVFIRSGAQPTNPDDAATGTLLVTFTFSGIPSLWTFTTSSTGTATITGAGLPKSGVIAATGTAGYFRVEDGSGNVIFDGTVGTSGADMILNNVSISVSGTITLDSFAFSIPRNC